MSLSWLQRLVAPRHRLREGVLPLALLAVAWSAFSLALHLGGHAPSGKLLLPVSAEHYYLAQAVFVAPVLFAGWWLLGSVLHAMARRLGGTGAREASFASAARCYALPTLALFLLPDVAVYTLGGHAAMGQALRYYAPLSPLASLVLLTSTTKRLHRLTTPRAFAAAALALLCFAVVVGVALR